LTSPASRFIPFVVSVLVVLSLCACGQPVPAGTKPPPPNISNDAIISAVLTFRACPTQADTLQSMAAKVLAQRNATVQGTASVRRYGDQAQVAIAYQKQGSFGEATFTYTLSSGTVVASNTTGQQTLAALSAECG
jgi:hypothetical protein